MENDPKLQNALKLYDLAEKRLESLEKGDHSDDNTNKLRSTIIELNQMLKTDVKLAKEIEKRRGADLTSYGVYKGRTIEAMIYWAHLDEMSGELDKLVKSSANIAEILSPQVIVGNKVTEMKMKREPKTKEAIELLKRQQIEESVRFGADWDQAENKGKLTFRSFFNGGAIVHKEIEDDLNIRAKNGDEIAKSALVKIERRTEAASLNRDHYIGKMYAAFAALSCAEVRDLMYQDIDVIFSRKDESEILKYQEALKRSSAAIENKITEMFKQTGDKQKLWEDRKQVLYKNIEMGGIVPLELIDKSKIEIESFFSARTRNKAQIVESLAYLVFADHALKMLLNESSGQS